MDGLYSGRFLGMLALLSIFSVVSSVPVFTKPLPPATPTVVLSHERQRCFVSCSCEHLGHVSCTVDGRFLSSVDNFNYFLLNISQSRETRVHFDLGDHSHTNLPGFIRHLPMMQYLSIAEGQLSVVQGGVLRGMRLLELNLSHNAIQTIEDGALQDLVYLRVLDLSYNRLTEVSKTVFADFPSLEVLNLRHNQLAYFPLDASSQVPKLKVLVLDDNLLTYLMPGSLFSLSSLQILGLKNNNLRSLVVDIAEELPSLQVLDVSYNPFHCSCSSYGFVRLLNTSENKLMDTEHITCDTPLSVRGRLVRDVLFGLSDCVEPETLLWYDEKNVLYITDAEVGCDVRGDPDPAILWVTPWGHHFAHRTHQPQLEGVCENCKQDRVYLGVGMDLKSQVSVVNRGRVLRITNYRGYFDGNITCHAYNYLGNTTAVRQLHVFSEVQRVIHQSLIIGGFCAAGFLCFGLIVGSIKLSILACIKHCGKLKNIAHTPVTKKASDDFEEHDSLTMGDGDHCRDESMDFDDYYPPETPFTTPVVPSPPTSPGKDHSPENGSPPNGWRPAAIIDTMEEVRWRLRYGMGRKVQTVRQSVQNMKESGSVYVHNIMESGSTAALKVKAGVVLGVETVKSHVQSIREFCGTGDMGGQTISMISVETNLDTNETHEVIKSITTV